jgi:hypothetical protein
VSTRGNRFLGSSTVTTTTVFLVSHDGEYNEENDDEYNDDEHEDNERTAMAGRTTRTTKTPLRGQIWYGNSQRINARHSVVVDNNDVTRRRRRHGRRRRHSDVDVVVFDDSTNRHVKVSEPKTMRSSKRICWSRKFVIGT